MAYFALHLEAAVSTRVREIVTQWTSPPRALDDQKTDLLAAGKKPALLIRIDLYKLS